MRVVRIIPTDQLDDRKIIGRVRTTKVRDLSNGLIGVPNAGEVQELAVSTIWTWSSMPWGRLPDGTSNADSEDDETWWLAGVSLWAVDGPAQPVIDLPARLLQWITWSDPIVTVLSMRTEDGRVGDAANANVWLEDIRHGDDEGPSDAHGLDAVTPVFKRVLMGLKRDACPLFTEQAHPLRADQAKDGDIVTLVVCCQFSEQG